MSATPGSAAPRTQTVPSVTVDQMREVDRLMAEELGISLVQMMENAGRAQAETFGDFAGATRPVTRVTARGTTRAAEQRMSEHFDAIIIGSGQGGTPLATTLAGKRRKTALIEREHVGGSCVNVGCTPTKTMIASARVAYLARRAADYGVGTGPVTVDLAKVRQRQRNIVNEWRDGKQRQLEHTEHLGLILGEAAFTGPKTVEVRLNNGGTRQLSSDLIVIDTGTRPVRPPIPGLDQVPTLDSTSIMELDMVPEHLLVLGGGYIGLEFAQMFRRFGSRVTVIEVTSRLLGHEDADVAEAVADILRQDGIEVLLETKAVRAETGPGSQIAMSIGPATAPEASSGTPAAGAPAARTLTGSHLLVAAGQSPNTDRLNLAAAGVRTDKQGYVEVNERLETNVPGIYALGDVKGGPAFTHISYDDFSILYANVFAGGHRTTTDRPVPYVAFIDPQLGRVGLSESEARRQGRSIKVAKLPMNEVPRALETDETRGFMKAVVDAKSGQILGAAILGIEGGEIMAVLEVAMMGQLPYTALRDGVFAHPTLVESLNNLFYTIDS